MRIAVISHTYMVRANRGKLEALAGTGGHQILVVVPRRWMTRDTRQHFSVESSNEQSLSLVALGSWSLGSGSLVTYSPLALFRLLRRFRPDLVHLEEEPWSIAALQSCLICKVCRIPLVLFTWENIDRRLPLPFRIIQRWVLRHSRAAVAGNSEAMTLLERRGFAGAIIVLPQLGVDTTLFHPGPARAPRRFVVGYVGRLVKQKGLLVLLEAVARLSADMRLTVVGTGPFRDEFLSKAKELGLEGRLELLEGVSHQDVPRHIRAMSVLVLPSLTTPQWKEQFGHVLIEAMSSEVPVVGSESGAIPEVIKEAGLVVPEGNVKALADALVRLSCSPAFAADLGRRGRERVLAEYTNEVVANRLAVFWGSALPRRGRPA